MEKNIAATTKPVSDSHQSPEPEPPLEGTPTPHKEKVRGEHSLNVHLSYELKSRLTALAEKYELSLSDVVRQVIKCGFPVFESLSASQEELLSGFVQLLRKSRSMGELKR